MTSGQANPRRHPNLFDVDTYIAQQTDVLWRANQGHTMMKTGNRGTRSLYGRNSSRVFPSPLQYFQTDLPQQVLAAVNAAASRRSTGKVGLDRTQFEVAVRCSNSPSLSKSELRGA